MKRFISLFIFCILFSFTIFGQSIEQVKPWLGISIESKPNGVNIIQAIQGTPAEKAGLKKVTSLRK
jgi:C-terminal processing protease CtpA/Prc